MKLVSKWWLMIECDGTQQKIVTDISASRTRIEMIDRRAEELLNTNSAAPSSVRSRQKAIHDRWDSINKLRQAKERSLQGASR